MSMVKHSLDRIFVLKACLYYGVAFFLVSVVMLPTAFARGPASVADIAEQLESVVVNISTATIRKREVNKTRPKIPKDSPFEDLFKDFFRDNGQGIPNKKVSSLGSGFVVGETGVIVTNNHVIEESDEIFVTFRDGRKLKVDKVLGRDKKTDIAVLKVSPKKPLKVARFGDSKKIRIGDWVMAIGNPFGLGGTVTVGIISAKNRDINSGPYDDFIQTDAAINKGNSGGPLFNMDGEVIGINTAIISPSGGSIGIGFAVPSLTAENIIDQLIHNGRVRRGWLGVRIQSLSKSIAESLGLKSVKGAIISHISPDSPAQKAGLKLGDVIISFGGQEIKSMRRLPKLISRSRVDKDIEVVYVRDGKTDKLMVKIAELEESKEDELSVVKVKDRSSSNRKKPLTRSKNTGVLGMRYAVLTKKLRRLHHIKAKVKGVLIAAVKKGSLADKRRITKGNVVVEVSQQSVSTPRDIMKEVNKARKKGKKSVLFLVSSGKGILRFIVLPIKSR